MISSFSSSLSALPPCIQVHIDKNSKTRILSSSELEHCKSLEHVSKEFTSKIVMFHQELDSIFNQVSHAAEQTKMEKLKVIGFRNLIEKEIEDREIREISLQARLRDKQREIERSRDEYDNLLAYLKDQEEQIERIQKIL